MYWSSRLVELRQLAQDYYLINLDLIGGVVAEPAPLQFVMIWVPGVDEMPMSVADYDSGRLTVIFRVRGEGTRALSRGPRFLGVRGFYGRGFRVESGDRILYIAGGIGIAPFPYMARVAERVKATIDLAWGVRRGVEVFDVKSIAPYSSVRDVKIATEDCSIGYCGTVVELANSVYDVKTYDKVIAVGPNVMLSKVCETMGGDVIVAPEVMTKCGIGACGSCTLKPHPLLLCLNGVYFSCREIAEFLVRE